MLVAEEFVGTLDDDAVATRVETEAHLTITVDDVERRRSRFRTTADDGRDIGVVVARDLRDGDVLDAGGTLVVVSLEPVDALVIDFGGVRAPDTGVLTAALELGHAVGNRHWDLTVEDECAYLPLADSRDRMAATIDPHLPDGARTRTEPVQPTLFDAGSTGGGHEHDHGDGGHSHDAAGHSHSHATHDHPHSHDAGDHSHSQDGGGQAPDLRTLDSDGGEQP